MVAKCIKILSYIRLLENVCGLCGVIAIPNLNSVFQLFVVVGCGGFKFRRPLDRLLSKLSNGMAFIWNVEWAAEIKASVTSHRWTIGNCYDMHIYRCAVCIIMYFAICFAAIITAKCDENPFVFLLTLFWWACSCHTEWIDSNNHKPHTQTHKYNHR